MTDTDACRYRQPWARVEKLVKPFRATNNRKVRRERWWQYAERAVGFYEAIASLNRVLVIAKTSRTQIPALVSVRQVLSDMLIAIVSDRESSLALHSSEFQYSWTAKYSAGLKADLRFFPSDCFENFPQPTHTDRLAEAGRMLDTIRPGVMIRRESGLTALYNDVHNESIADSDIVRLREIHVEIDEAVRDAYAQDEDRDPRIRAFEARIASAPLPSWREVDLAHGFHDTPQGPRFTISPQARTDVLDKLLALNHYRHQQELASGLLNSNKKKSRPKPRPAAQDTPTVDDGTLFPPPDTLF